MENFRPSPTHWASLAKMVVEENIFNEYLEMAYQQAFWQFCISLGQSDVKASTQCAKENAVLSLIYINFTRMVLSQMVKATETEILPVLPLEFLNKLAKIDNDEDMRKFVNEDFRPLVCAPNSAEDVNFPKFTRAFDVVSKVARYLTKTVSNCFSFRYYIREYYMENLKKVNWCTKLHK